jgi:hypothetical protein
LNSIECVRCLVMGFLLESPGQLADSQVPYLSTRTGALHFQGKSGTGNSLAILGRSRLEPITSPTSNLELIWLTGVARPANRAARSLRRSLRARFARRPHGHPQSKRHQPQFKG